MKVAVLDDGINKRFINIPVISFDTIPDEKANKNTISHGTTCASIIERFGKADLFYDIRYISDDGSSDIDKLIKALELCYNLDIQVINLSSGIENFIYGSKKYRKLYEICEKLSCKGIHIFAAQSNSGKKTIPADFQCVSSVEDITGFLKKDKKFYRCSDIYAPSWHIIKLNGKYSFSDMCNSYACAYASAAFTAFNKKFLIFSHELTSSSFFYYNRYIAHNKFIIRIKGDILNIYNNDKNSRYVLSRKPVSFARRLLSFISKERMTYYGYDPLFSFKKKSDVPIIFFVSKNYDSLTLKSIFLTVGYFRNKGYLADILSDIPTLFTLDVPYIGKGDIIKKIALYQHWNNSDITFVICKKIPQNISNADKLIIIRNNLFVIDKKEIPLRKPEAVRMLYDTITSFYEVDD